MTFGEKLKKLRESRKLTQTQMADMLGVSLRTYQYYESGRMYPKDKAVYQRTATRFNVTMDSLLGDQDLFIIDAQSKYCEQAFYRQMTRIFDRVKQRNAKRYAEKMRMHKSDDNDGDDE